MPLQMMLYLLLLENSSPFSWECKRCPTNTDEHGRVEKLADLHLALKEWLVVCLVGFNVTCVSR